MTVDRPPCHRETLVLLAFYACAAAGCAAADPEDDGPLDRRVDEPPALDPAAAIRFVTPDFVVPAGQEKMLCWASDWVPEQDYFVTAFDPHQGQGGHHFVILRSVAYIPPGEVWDCTDLATMASVEPLVILDSSEDTAMDEGFAIRLEAGTTIVTQSHYVNTSQQDWLVRDVGDLLLRAPEDVVTEANYVVVNHGLISLPPGPSDLSVGCTLPGEQDFNLMLMLGHMHELGSSIRVDAERGGGPEQLYLIEDWEVEFRDDPPIVRWSAAEPFALRGGDSIDLHCSYDNVTGGEVHFPAEMCTTVAVYWPADEHGLVICDEDEGADED